jgi:PKD domain
VSPVAVLVFRSTGERLFAVDPGNPSATVTLDFPKGVMTPVTLTGTPGQYHFIMAEGFSLLADVPVLQSQWTSVVDGTIGNDIFPKYQTKVGWGSTAAETADLSAPAYVFGDSADRTAVWADCVTCFGNTRPAGFPPGAAQVASLAAWARASATGPWNDLGVGARLLLANPNNAVGLAVFTYPSGSANKEWTDWVSFPAPKLPATLTPSTATADPNSDVSLTLTVTGAPGNLEYVWDFADGTPRTTTTVANTTHQWGTGSTYVVKVTARDKTTKQPVAKASTAVTIDGGVIAWKFNTMSVAFSTAGSNVNSDGRWLLDSTRFLRMRDGGSQGGIRLVETAYQGSGLPVRTVKEGLYIIEGASLTAATVNYPLNNNIFASVQFAGAPLTLAAAPQVYGWEAVRALQITPEPVCKDPSESFVRTGSATSGRVAGLTVQYCWDRFNPPQPGFEYLVGPRITIATDVTFSGTTATGTITLTYLFQQPSRVTQKKIATVTFTATRL